MIAFYFVLKHRFYTEDSLLDPLKSLEDFSWGFHGTEISHAVVLLSAGHTLKQPQEKCELVAAESLFYHHPGNTELASATSRELVPTGDNGLDSDPAASSEHPQ